jgi:hypothetical protein
MTLIPLTIFVILQNRMYRHTTCSGFRAFLPKGPHEKFSIVTIFITQFFQFVISHNKYGCKLSSQSVCTREDNGTIRKASIKKIDYEKKVGYTGSIDDRAYKKTG